MLFQSLRRLCWSRCRQMCHVFREPLPLSPFSISVSSSSSSSPSSPSLKPHTFVSFFLFESIPSPELLTDKLRSELQSRQFRGTIYVAKEGINGQFSVPSNHLNAFQEIIQGSFPPFRNIAFNVGDTYEEGENVNEITTFKRLSVKVRQHILTDGLEDSDIDWKNCGDSLSAAKWHEEVLSLSDNSNSILLDCRNAYESQIGTFNHAIPLNTKVFSETFDALGPLLKEIPKDARVLTFCTGGIRCVKVNAFLTQRLGFTNVASLEDGIVGYKRWLINDSVHDFRDDSVNNQPEFIGENYVFDRRRKQSISAESVELSVKPDQTDQN